MDAGTIRYRIENLYLNRMDGDGALETLQRHLAAHEWTESDRVRLAFAFHMHFTNRSRDEAFSEIVDLVQRLPRRDEQNYVAALILGFSGRILTDEQMERLKGVLSMTDLLKAIEQEALEKGLQQGRQEEKREVAERMFKRGASVADVVEITGLSEAEAEEIRRKALQ